MTGAHCADTSLSMRDGHLVLPPGREAQGPAVVGPALARAQKLIALVREEGTDGIGGYLDRLDQRQMYALVVTLAAMVPDDVPVGDLLTWITHPNQPTLMESA